MINWVRESLFPRFAATSAASDRRWQDPGRGRTDNCHLHLHHQALSQRPPRERPCAAQSHSRSPQRQRSGLTGRAVRTVASPPRCDARTTLSNVGSHPRPQGQHGLHHACAAGPGLDAKIKTIRASEQKEAERAAWRSQATDLPAVSANLLPRFVAD